MKFEALNPGGGMLAQNSIVSRGGYTGLDVQHTVRVHPADDCEVVHVDLYQTSGFVTLEAVGSLGVVVGRQTITGVSGAPQRVTFRAFRGRIHFVRVISPNAGCMILNVCCERTPFSAGQPNGNCLDFSEADAGQFPSPYKPEGAIITAKPDPVVVGPVNGLSGNWLKLSGEIDIRAEQPDEPCGGIALVIWDPEGVVKVTAYNVNNEVVGTAGPPPASNSPQRFVVSGNGIVRLVITSNSDKAMLQQICCGASGAQ